MKQEMKGVLSVTIEKAYRLTMSEPTNDYWSLFSGNALNESGNRLKCSKV